MNLETSEIILKDLKCSSWAETRREAGPGSLMKIHMIFIFPWYDRQPESFLIEFFNTVTESFCVDIYRTAGSIKKFAFDVK